jgi:hypothetical protein
MPYQEFDPKEYCLLKLKIKKVDYAALQRYAEDLWCEGYIRHKTVSALIHYYAKKVKAKTDARTRSEEQEKMIKNYNPYTYKQK